MTWPIIRALIMFGAAGWCSISLFKDAIRTGGALRGYDRAIRFLGALIMAGFAIGGGFLLAAGKVFSK
jgi:hypothetical protein